MANNDLLDLIIEENDKLDNCFIKNIKTKDCYSGFILYKSRITISCDVSFYKSSNTNKYIPRLIFKKLNKEGNDKFIANEKPINIELNNSLKAESFWKMIGFIHNFKDLVDVGDFQNIYKISKGNDNLTDENILEYLKKNPNLINKFIESDLTESDIISIGYRKSQLKIFEEMLNNDKLQESDWQSFFEKNTWIFGYGLSYIFQTSLDNKKLEQVVSGYDFNSNGKRVDGLLKTAGFIKSLCFVEIKTHKTNLLSTTEYRKGCWNISSEFSGAVSQIQNTVSLASKDIYGKIQLENGIGELTGEEVFNFQPKSFLIIGKLKELENNQSKYRSFELFRRNINSPEIITFDELYERAKYIVNQENTHEL